MCHLCGYVGENIKKHENSTIHLRGVAAVIYAIKRAYMLNWVQRELDAHDDGSVALRERQRHLREELSIRWTCDVRVMSLWGEYALWYGKRRRDFVLRNVSLRKLPAELVEFIVRALPECSQKYAKLSKNGATNFQMWTFNTAHRRSPLCTTRSAVMDLKPLACRSVTKWTKNYRGKLITT